MSINEPKMVAFDAFRDKPFHEDQQYITFDGMKVNVGGGFNPDTGMVCCNHNMLKDYHPIVIKTFSFFLYSGSPFI